MTMRVGTHLGRYELLAEIGRGGMGVVYRARDPKIDRIVAIKTISLFRQKPGDEREYRERFVFEARAAGRLSHPGIVTVFDVGEEPETHDPYIVMEHVDGESLSKLLAAEKGKMPLAPALHLIGELAEALHYAHSQGVIHRDIKPSNILVTPDYHPKIADFGIAKLNLAQLTVPGQLLGSPAYMAPEQLRGDGVDARSDLFSLGVILYTIVTGYRPFQGNSATTVCFKVVNREPLPITAYDVDLPVDLDKIVTRAMAKDPEKRYQSGLEMAHALQSFREDNGLLQDGDGFSTSARASRERVFASTGSLRSGYSRTPRRPDPLQVAADVWKGIHDKAYLGASIMFLGIASFVLYRGILSTQSRPLTTSSPSVAVTSAVPARAPIPEGAKTL